MKGVARRLRLFSEMEELLSLKLPRDHSKLGRKGGKLAAELNIMHASGGDDTAGREVCASILQGL